MSGVKCTGKRYQNIIACLCVLLTLSSLLTGCGPAYDMPYEAAANVSSFNIVSRQNTDTAETYAEDLCVVKDDILAEGIDVGTAEAAVLFDLNNNSVIYAKNAHESLYPASLTKIMTAMVALKYGSLDQTLTATSAVNITEPGAQLIGLKAGDTMTLDQALRILLLYSANDVAMLVAEGVGGSVENFVAMMNQEALSLGATNTNFTNPSGLPDSEHKTTAYDLYLIFNAALKYETFNEIIQMTSYQTTYYDKDGEPKEFDKSTTNRFLKGDFQPPSGVTVIGGKTGTTNAAGHCLILLARDVSGAPYISVILRAESSDQLYEGMGHLLEGIHN